MSAEFRALVIEGVFYRLDGRLHCRQDDGEECLVLDRLSLFLGEAVHFAAQHVPPNPPRVGSWGLGSCLGEATGWCSYHHRDPHRLFQTHGQGTLVGEGSRWWVRGVDGSPLARGVEEVLDGHHGRILMASAWTVDQMRDRVLASGMGDRVQDLTHKAEDLRAVVGKIVDSTGGD